MRPMHKANCIVHEVYGLFMTGKSTGKKKQLVIKLLLNFV